MCKLASEARENVEKMAASNTEKKEIPERKQQEPK
jgi:hypothetical protein